MPPYRIDEAGNVSDFGETTGTIVGMLEEVVYEDRKDILYPNEYIVMYTDGVTEARSTDGKFYGEETFINLLAACAGKPVTELCDSAISEVCGFQARNLSDDVTLLALRRLN